MITAVQKTRFTDEHIFDSEGFRHMNNERNPALRNGLYSELDSIVDFGSPNERLPYLTFKSTNKLYTMVNAHAPIMKIINGIRKSGSILEDFG